jgi:hypothetical protein
MDNLKRNLHYVVFGGGILLGLILFGAGFVYRSGGEGALATSITNLDKRKNVATQGELGQAERERDEFDRANQSALATLGSTGQSLRNGLSEVVSVARFSSETEPKVSELQSRFDAMNKPQGFPSKLKGWSWVSIGGTRNTYWTDFKADLTNPDKIPELQLQLRLLEEVCVTCELMLRSGRFPDQGANLRSLKVEPQRKWSNRDEVDSPWEMWEFTLDIECSPEFGYALMDELLSSSDLTSGKSGAGKDTANERRRFPIELDSMQSESLPRPPALLRYITPAERAAEGVGENLDPESDEGKAEAKRLAQEYERDVRPALPLRFGMKMRALNFNPKWQVVAQPEQG